jgi:hypothetical protein
MSRRNVDPTLPRFLEIGTRWEELTVISQVHRLITHWEPREFRSRLCGGAMCGVCRTGRQKLARYYMMLLDGQGRDKLLEVRARQMEVLDPYDTTVGLVVRIRKEGTAGNSPVSVAVVGERQVVERDISRLVARFCLPAIVDPNYVEIDAVVEQLVGGGGSADIAAAGEIPNPEGYEDFA